MKLLIPTNGSLSNCKTARSSSCFRSRSSQCSSSRLRADRLKIGCRASGIVSFELAGKLSLAQEMVKSWGQLGQVYAGVNIGFDFVYIITYVIAIGLGCVIVARGGFLSSVGVVLAWAMFAAGLFDCIENYNLIQFCLVLGKR